MGDRPLFRLVVRKSVDVCGGPSSGTEYSLEGACPVCGTGAVQAGALRLPRFKPPAADLFSTLDDEVLVSARLSDRLREAGVRSLQTVVQADTGEALPFTQLLPEATLPPFSAATTGFARERPCPACGRDGYFGVPRTPLELTYENLPAEFLAKDVLATFERFGNSRRRTPFRDSVFAAPLYVVGSRIAEMLRAQRVRTAALEPVRLVVAAAAGAR
jgi:rRNA maturation protein Nop10